mgnify:CR=1 FL=1
MDINMQKRNEVLAQNVITRSGISQYVRLLRRRQRSCCKAGTGTDPGGSSIAMGGCTSAHEIGLIKRWKMEIIIILIVRKCHQEKA